MQKNRKIPGLGKAGYSLCLKLCRGVWYGCLSISSINTYILQINYVINVVFV